MPELSRLQDMLIQQPAYLYFGSLERIMALVLQIAFTMLVLYAVKQKKYIFLVYAILFHALVDFFAALYQTKTINIFVAEGITLLFTIGAIILIRKMKEKLMSVPVKITRLLVGYFYKDYHSDDNFYRFVAPSLFLHL